MRNRGLFLLCRLPKRLPQLGRLEDGVPAEMRAASRCHDPALASPFKDVHLRPGTVGVRKRAARRGRLVLESREQGVETDVAQLGEEPLDVRSRQGPEGAKREGRVFRHHRTRHDACRRRTLFASDFLRRALNLRYCRGKKSGLVDGMCVCVLFCKVTYGQWPET